MQEKAFAGMTHFWNLGKSAWKTFHDLARPMNENVRDLPRKTAELPEMVLGKK